jgi:hypothetical protein
VAALLVQSIQQGISIGLTNSALEVHIHQEAIVPTGKVEQRCRG